MAAADAALAAADEQQAAMMAERVILIDDNDNVIGHASKKESHLLSNIEDNMLHRAFSVFLFTPEGKLILQQRAASKVTFPAYWANTCCSHPLHFPAELETTQHLGVKRAAVRKLEQELGIPPEDIPLDCLHFVTRIHYMAPANDPDNLWAEHEIDHILIATPPSMPRLAPNPNEVDTVQAFTPTEMAEWVQAAEGAGVAVAPWFKCMERTMLYRWWSALAAGALGPVVEPSVIHRFGKPPYALPAHADVLRDARAAEDAVEAHAARAADGRGVPCLLGADAVTAAAAPSGAGVGDAGRKQGAYGRVVTHSEGVLAQLMHVDEVWAAALYKTGMSAATAVAALPADASPATLFCEEVLGKVSRSFAMVIRQLSPRLRSSICVFYLVLRGLDTVEDDMTAFAGREEEKVAHLNAFHTYLRQAGWSMTGVGEGDERTLLESFHHVVAAFGELPEGDRDVISDITAKMGEGMARFAGRDLLQGTEDLAEYNLYCHYVAGLVGEGLTRLFVSSGRQAPGIEADMTVANHMGLFLQKTNIIRDYLEDLVEGRAFWPRSVWSRYAPKLAHLRGTGGPSASAVPPGEEPGSAGSARDPHIPHAGSLACLNHLIADAMAHVPHCLAYLEALQAEDVFRFCAIPQVMAIATLDKLACNPGVFTGVVKIRKGQAVQLIQQAGSRTAVWGVFLRHTRSIVNKLNGFMVRSGGAPAPAFSRALQAAAAAEAWTIARLPHGSLTAMFDARVVGAVALTLLALLRHLNERSTHWGGYVPRITDSWDVLALTAAVAAVLYILAFTGVPLVLWSVGVTPEEEAAGSKGLALAGPTPKAIAAAPAYDVPTSEVTFPTRRTARRETGSPVSAAAAAAEKPTLRARRGGMAE